MGDVIKFPSKKPPGSDKTVREVFETMTEEQKNVLYFMVGQAIEDTESKNRFWRR